MRSIGALALAAALGAAAAADERGKLMHEHERGDFARGIHSGTQIDGRGLALAAGVASGSYEAPPIELAAFDRAVVSVNAELDGGATCSVSARVKLDDATWSSWIPLGALGGPDESLPRSDAGPRDGPVRVDVDTLTVERARGRALAWRLELTRGSAAHVRRVAACAWLHARREPETRAAHSAWGRVLAVPARSQRVEDHAISGRICSPTSLAMVLAFHGIDRPTRDVARAVRDRRADIFGNWALNVAFAGSLGLAASVARLSSIDQLEDEIVAGRPVVISHRWSSGELANAPIASSDGHLIVVRGFAANGDVVVNDPAADPAHVERTYARHDIERTWLENGDGIAYLIEKR